MTPKLENHLYLIKRENGDYFLAYPLEDIDGELIGWWDQNCVSHPYYEDDDIIGSVDRIEERRYVRVNRAKAFLNAIGQNDKCQIELEKVNAE